MTIELYTKINGKLVPSKASVFTFPGGERHIKFERGDLQGENYALVRGADANDYIAAQMWVGAVHASGGEAHAVIPYLPGARADRGVPLGAAYYAQMIRQAFFDSLIFFDGHSRVMPEMVIDKNCRTNVEIHAWSVIENVLGDFRPDFVISPDAGARDRSQAVATKLKVPLYSASKKRDFETGKLSGFECEKVPETGHGLIVDDICDAGGTFLGVKEATGLPWDRISLYVSHGIFSGTEQRNRDLQKSFSRIYTTNSHHDFKYSLTNTFPSNVVASDILQVLEAYL